VNDANDEPENTLIQYLVATVGCAMCGASYAAEDVKVLDHRGNAWIIILACSQCGTRGLVLAMVTNQGQPDRLGELSAAEMETFANMPPLDGDDVLDWHMFLRDYEGDLAGLLEADQ